jgi:hypothetical protein
MINTAEWNRCTRVLGLRPEAGFNEIQAAYRRLVLRYHPDINHTLKAPVRFREIVEAYGTILEYLRTKANISSEELYTTVKKDPVVKKMKFEELENRFKYSSSAQLRTSVLVALEMYRDERTKKLLFDALRDDNEKVQLTALKILEKSCCIRDVPKIFMSLSIVKKRKVRKELLHTIFRIIKQGSKNISAQCDSMHREERVAC